MFECISSVLARVIMGGEPSKPLRDQIRDQKRTIDRSARQMDREKQKLEREEQVSLDSR